MKNHLRATTQALPPSVGPIDAVILQSVTQCNLDCDYCYLSAESRRRRRVMPLDTLSTIFSRVFSSGLLGNQLHVGWHCGEPTLNPPQYYREAMRAIIAQSLAENDPAVRVDFDIQTNGTRLSQEWCDLLIESEGRLQIGISCDGPAFLHDDHRKRWNGVGTHASVEAGMKLLCENSIPFDVVAVVSEKGLRNPKRFLEYFSQFAPYVRNFHYNLHDQPFQGNASEKEIENYTTLYRDFVEQLLEYISSPGALPLPAVRNFSRLHDRIFSPNGSSTAYDARATSRPFKTLSIEANGDVTTFYTGLTQDECRDLAHLYGDGRGFSIGNILTNDIQEMLRSDKLLRIAEDFETSHAFCEAECEYYRLCPGGYNLIKQRRFGRFDVSETPECRLHVKTFADAVLDDMQRHVG